MTYGDGKCVKLCGVTLGACALALLVLTFATPASPAQAVYEKSKETARKSGSKPSPSDTHVGKKISKHKVSVSDRAMGLVRPQRHAKEPKIVLVGPDLDGIVGHEKIWLRGFVEGPDAMRVRVNGTETKTSGSIFFAEVDLKKGKNTFAVTATAPGGTRARKTFEVTYQSPSEPESDPEARTFQSQSGDFAAQESLPGATFSVNSTEDATDAKPGDGVCATAASVCTLRAAIQETNASSGQDTIDLPAGNYALTIPGCEEDAGATGDLDVTDAAGLIIEGAGQGFTTIDARQIDRVIHAFSPADLEIRGVAITGGDAKYTLEYNNDPYYDHGAGGGICVEDGNLTLENSTVSDNDSYSDGGGIYVYGDLRLSGSIISNNTSGNHGGGAYAELGDLTVSDSTFANNTADGDGGGMGHNDSNTFSLRGTTVSNNTADRVGGGIVDHGDGGSAATFEVINSVVEGNTASAGGGGIANFAENLIVSSSTVRGNIVSGNDKYGGRGGGGILDYSEISIQIDHSFIENNTSVGRVGGGGVLSLMGDTKFTITDSTIKDNTASGDYGGGVANFASVFHMEDSTVSNNTINSGQNADLSYDYYEGQGGGIGTSGPSTVITNTTVSGNSANGGEGGGIYNDWDAKLNHVTLQGNGAPTGGNLFNWGTGILQNSIVSSSTGGESCTNGDPAMWPIVSEGHNLDSGDSCGFDQPTDLTNTDPLLEPLADNGGPTKTHALQPGSPAIDAGGNYCPPTDQRGVARMHDGDGNGTALADIGAYELESASGTTKPCTFGKFEVEVSAPESLMVDNGALTPNPFTVSATVRYDGYAPTEGSNVILSTSPKGLTVEGEKMISLGTMNPGEERRVSWQVRASEFGSERSYKLYAKAGAAGLKPKVASTQITVPALPDAPPPEESACRTPYPDARPTENTPLILVPGIGGTELFNAEGKELWPGLQEMQESDTDEHLLGLRLNEKGTGSLENGPAYDITVGDLVRDGTINLVEPLPGDLNMPYTKDVYKATVEYLEQNADYEEGVDLFVFPFDWRKDVVEAGNEEDRRLIDKIDCVLESTGAERVDIMAHSQGGLVMMAALSSPESEGKVRKVLTLGTPVLGATKALGVLEYQMPCFSELKFLGCISNPATTQEVMTNFPGAYQLLPSPAFDEAEGPPLIVEDEEWGYDKWSKIVDRNRNAGLRELAFDFHQEIFDDFAPADPSVEFKRVVGTGLSTADRIREYEAQECIYVDPSYECETVIEREVLYAEPYRSTIGDGVIIEKPMDSGDGTVPRGSAEAGLGEDESNIYFDGVQHMDLAMDEDVLEYAASYFGGQQEKNGTVTMSAMSSSVNSGPSDGPSPFDGIELQAIGPVKGYVRDQTGKVLGSYPGQPEGMILTTIPGGIYDAISDTQSFFLNEQGSYKAELAVRSKEGTKLRVRTYAESRMDGQAVFEVNASAEADLRLGFATGQDLKDLRLFVDNNGDGTVDKKLAPKSVATGPAASEIDPPETRATLKPVGKNKVKVTLSATDGAKGSGIAATYYFVEGSPSQRTYERPFVAPRGTTVRFYSVDRVGNEELSKEIKTPKKPVPPAPKPKPATCTIKGTNGNDILRGTAKDDVICGLGGNDVIDAGKGDDTVRGGAGNDVIRGSSGNDRLDGGGGNDKLDGQSGKDALIGGRGNDVLNSKDRQRGNDKLDGGPGKDSCRSDSRDETRRCRP